MDFALSDDHLALRDAVQRFCAQEYPATTRGNPEPAPLAAQRWTAMAELGLMGLPVPEEHGGSGLGTVELMLVAQELGRTLAGGAWFSTTALCVPLLVRAANAAQQARWLPAAASGALQIALAHAEADARHDLAHVNTRAVPHEQGWQIDGRKTLVLHGDGAGLLLVAARTAGAAGTATARHGLSLFAIAADAPGVTVQGFDTLDGRRAAHIEFKAVMARRDDLVGDLDAAWPLIDEAVDRCIAVLCGEAAGAIDALLVQTAEHLRTRQQFGQQLSRFQALQHKLADMLIGLEQVKSMACAAAMAVDGDDVALRRRVTSAAKVLSGQQGRLIGMAAIQMHGGMGMTDEARIGHYAKRLMVINQLFGDAGHHLQAVAAAAHAEHAVAA